jgi:hypothetical protein
MKRLFRAIDAYDDLVRQREDEAPQLLADILRRSDELGVTYGGQPVPTALRPNILTSAQMQIVRRSVLLLANCIERLARLYGQVAEVQRLVQFRPRERHLILRPRANARQVVIARLDAFLDGNSLRYNEFNTDSPAGAGYTGMQRVIFDETALMKQFVKLYPLEGEAPQEALVDALLGAFAESGIQEEPRVLISDWDDVGTLGEFGIIVRLLAKRGVRAVIADPRTVDFDGQYLRAGDFKANLVYRRVILRELAEKWDECKELIEAESSPTVCFANPFRSKVAGSKACLAVLTDPRFARFFTEEELAAVRAHVPWTRVVTEQEVSFRGQQMPAFDLGARFKNELVLKPTNEYAGRGVHIGAELDQGTWEKALGDAEPYAWVLQERIMAPERDFPLVTDKLEFLSRKVNLNPFALGGKYGGSLTRISEASIINVSRGGGMVPTYVLSSEDRSQQGE